jgi:hypothetical protein
MIGGTRRAETEEVSETRSDRSRKGEMYRKRPMRSPNGSRR